MCCVYYTKLDCGLPKKGFKVALPHYNEHFEILRCILNFKIEFGLCVEAGLLPYKGRGCFQPHFFRTLHSLILTILTNFVQKFESWCLLLASKS